MMMTNNLKQATENTPDVAGNFRNGIQAIKGEYKEKIKVSDTKKLTGSVDIDAATKEMYPQDNRWDYAIEYNKEVFFIEFHPASTKKVEEVIKKLSWLKKWLKENAPLIDELKSKETSPYHWIATSSIKILPESKQAKLLAQSGLRLSKHMQLK